MPVPILVVTGFLGAGKTTLINGLLRQPGSRRLAAVVNDFGAINIDAALLASASDDVVSLKNGCICCSLQGDLLQTLSKLLRRAPAPDGIVIETSGVADAAGVILALLDPVIWREAALDTVVCLVDARNLVDAPAMLDDPLYRSQIKSADFLALNKTDLLSAQELASVRARLRLLKPARMIYDVRDGQLPPELLFSAPARSPVALSSSRFSTSGFESFSWTCRTPLSLQLFQTAITRLAGRVLRAKGLVEFADQPGKAMVFQLEGERATISPAMAAPIGDPVQLVFIARDGDLDQPGLRAMLETCVEQPRSLS